MPDEEDPGDEIVGPLVMLVLSVGIIAYGMVAVVRGGEARHDGNKNTKPEAVTLGDTFNLIIANGYIAEEISISAVPLVTKEGKSIRWLEEIKSIDAVPSQLVGWWVRRDTGVPVRPSITDPKTMVTLTLTHNRELLDQDLAVIVSIGTDPARSHRLFFHVTTPEKKARYASAINDAPWGFLIVCFGLLVFFGAVNSLWGGIVRWRRMKRIGWYRG